MRTALAAVLLAALLGWLAWPAPAAGGWRSLAVTDMVQVIALGDVEVAANLQQANGRVLAVRPLELVFRRATAPRELTVVAPEGALRLFLGDAGPVLAVGAEGARLEGAGEPAVVALSAEERQGPLTLRCAGGEVAVLAGPRVLLAAPWTGAAPEGRAGARLLAQASFGELTLLSDEGAQTLREEREAQPLGRPLWAAGAALLLLPALVALVRVRRGGRGGGLLAALSLAALVAGLGVTLWVQNRERLRPPDAECASEPVTMPAPRRVELYRPFTVPGGAHGDFHLELGIVLDEASVLDVLLRGAPADRDRGLVLTLSSDPRLPSGLSVNLATEWQPGRAPPAQVTLPVGRPLRVTVEARGADVVARVDGKLLGERRDLDLRAGRTALHALRGGATLETLELVPGGPPADLAGLLGRWIALAAVTALAGAAILGGVLAAPVLTGLLLAPLAVACWPFAPAGVLAAGAALTLGLATALAPAGRRVPALLLAAGLGVLAGRVAAEAQPPYSPGALNQLRISDVRGGPVPLDYLWARHPLCRRFSDFVRDQRFRSGPVTRERPEGVAFRIVALGSSSTFGYGLGAEQNWPAFLEQRYRGQAEVINAGTLGATAERLRPLLEGVLLPLRPDLVVVDLSFNDHSFGPLYDERAHFAQFTGDGVSRAEQGRELWAEWRLESAWREYFGALDAGEAPAPELRERFETGPTARFADSLRDIVRAAEAAGARVLLVAEPFRPGLDHPTLPPYRATVLAVGAELGVAVADPQPALEALGEAVFIDAVHPTEAGHRALADEIFKVIAREGLLRPSR